MPVKEPPVTTTVALPGAKVEEAFLPLFLTKEIGDEAEESR